MTTTPTNNSETESLTYGNWQAKPRGGMFKLGNAGTLVAGGVILGMMVCFAVFGLLVGLIWAGVGIGAVALAAIRDRDQRTTIEKIGTRLQALAARGTRSNVYRSAALTPPGVTRPTGIASSITVTEWENEYGQPFALLSYPQGYHTIVFSSSPDGSTNADEDDVNLMVAYYSEWLATQSSVPGLLGSSVTVETAPDTGGGLRRSIEESEADDAPPLCREVMDEIADRYPEGSADTRCWISFTFTEKGRIERDRDRQVRIQRMAASVAQDMADLIATLAHAGAGAVVPVDVQTLCELMRVSYDPEVAPEVEAAHAAGVSIEAMTWDRSGPVAHQEHWGYYLHDSGISSSFVMTRPPRQAVPATVLRRLFAPGPYARKRITLAYQVLPDEEAADAVDKNLADATFAENTAKKKTARHKRQIQAAELTAREEAGGAGVVDFTIYATVTLLGNDVKAIEAASVKLRNSAAASKLRMRRLYGAQAAGFHLTQPLGLQPKLHVASPQMIAGENR